LKGLRILSAGVALLAATDTVAKWNAENPDFPAVLDSGGSVDLIRRVLGGEPCDLLILADSVIIEIMLMPEHADGYCVFAGNRMVLRATEDHNLNENNWKDKLLSPKTVFTHTDPFGDPGGYRAVMTMKLADEFEAGLSDKLLHHPGYAGLKRGQSARSLPPHDYMFYYYTGALAADVPFAVLPPVMDLSDEGLADAYAKVSFDISETITVSGAPIRHAMTVPCMAQNPPLAREFAELFLHYDFAGKGFLPRCGKVGSWI